ncbi:hypothetical protein JYT44_00335 [Caldithrix abyssi]|nr:hypothetical protein [Caldithrix abyssi]
MECMFRTDEYNEAASALEMLSESSSKVFDDVYHWKWIVIFLHSALQSFMVLALKGGSGLNVLKDEIAEKWLEAYHEGKPFPKKFLDNFPGLYEKIKSEMMKRNVDSKQFVPVGDEDQSVEDLNWFRNKFTHFIPSLWSIDVSGLPEICMDCLNVIRFLGWECGNVHWHDPEVKGRSKLALAAAKSNFESLKEKYDVDS